MIKTHVFVRTTREHLESLEPTCIVELLMPSIQVIEMATVEFGFYCFESNSTSVRLRRPCAYPTIVTASTRVLNLDILKKFIVMSRGGLVKAVQARSFLATNLLMMDHNPQHSMVDEMVSLFLESAIIKGILVAEDDGGNDVGYRAAHWALFDCIDDVYDAMAREQGHDG